MVKEFLFTLNQILFNIIENKSKDKKENYHFLYTQSKGKKKIFDNMHAIKH